MKFKYYRDAKEMREDMKTGRINKGETIILDEAGTIDFSKLKGIDPILDHYRKSGNLID